VTVSSNTSGRRNKRILVPLYSQSGQLIQIAEQILAPLQESGEFDITRLPIKPLKPYPFPWTFFRFLDAFPEAIHQVTPAIEPLGLTETDEFDLIILPYQIWFLSASLPTQALLQNPAFERVARGKPVITVIACRNMWHLAHEKVKASLKAIGARLLDNVVLTDQGGTFATFFTVPRWVLTGKNTPFMGFPPAGVHPDEIKRARRFGLALRDALRSDQEKNNQPLLSGLQAVVAEPTLLVSERAGTRSFTVWGKLLRAVGEPGDIARMPILLFYVVFLIAMIATVVPVSLLLQMILRPFLRGKIAAAKQYFEAPSGSGSERLQQYE
jgi:hypothetical protein